YSGTISTFLEKENVAGMRNSENSDVQACHLTPQKNEIDIRFDFTNPKANGTIPLKKIALTVKDGETIKCAWKKNKGAEVHKVDSCDLYTEHGLVANLWNKTVNFKSTSASAEVRIKVPKEYESKLPFNFILRSWGSTKNGPQCTCYR
ncbi:16844_t:CDS:2, partial [Acaulospora colombiana]